MFSVKEPTWDKDLRQHTCCGSKHSYHKTNCPLKFQRIPGRSSDPDFINVQRLRMENPGITSRDVSRQLGLPLSQVNDLWVL